MSRSILKNKEMKGDDSDSESTLNEDCNEVECETIVKGRDLRADDSEYRSIIKNKEPEVYDVESRRGSVKKLHFDESIIEIRPSYADPVDAEILRTKLERLQRQQLQNRPVDIARHGLSARESSIIMKIPEQLQQTVMTGDVERLNTTPQESFEVRRKQFYKDEYKKVMESLNIPSCSSNISNEASCSRENSPH